jgi:hypothetical protein
VHIAQGIIIALLFLPFLTVFEFYLVVIFPFLIDLDFLFSKFAKNKNHRRLITHSLLPYIALLTFGFIYPVFFILGLCGVVHLLIDMIDWGTALLAPFYRDPIGGVLPHVPLNLISEANFEQRQCWFTKTYYRSKVILTVEVLIVLLAISLILIIAVQYLWLMVLYSLFLAFHLTYYVSCRRK